MEDNVVQGTFGKIVPDVIEPTEAGVSAAEQNEATLPMYAVNEIFDSIQGEGAFLGVPVTFIRMQGCNLACSFCDTAESLPRGIKSSTIENIVKECHKEMVVITGGEPCMQDLEPLIEELQKLDKMVCIETNGSLPTPPNANWITCSPKEAFGYRINESCHANEFKFVVTPEFKLEDIPASLRAEPTGMIWLQPEGSQMQEMWKKAYDMAMNSDVLRVGVQLHKIMEVK